MAQSANRLPVGLCWGTLFNASLPELIQEAGRHGFTTISPTPPTYRRALEQGITAKDLRAMLKDNGVRATVIDPLMAGLPGSPPPSEVPEQFRIGFMHDEAYCYEVAEALEAKVVNIAHFLGKKVPIAQLADAIGKISERAATRGLGISLEFIPDTGMPDLVTAAEIVRQVKANNLGVLLDTWHLSRSGGTLEQLAALPPGTINGFQLSDRIAPPPGTPYVPMSGRNFPGEGEMPLAEIVRLAQANRPGLTAEIEVFNAELRALSAADAAKMVSDKTRGWLTGKGAEIKWN
jgi:sugar phosphate isomerase/epimerase